MLGFVCLIKTQNNPHNLWARFWQGWGLMGWGDCRVICDNNELINNTMGHIDHQNIFIWPCFKISDFIQLRSGLR